MNKRESFLLLVDQEWTRFISAVRSVPVDWLAEPDAAGSWSVRDVIGHIATWDRVILGILQGDEEARRAAVHDLDSFNAAEVRKDRKLRADQVLRRLEATHAALRDTLEAAPAEVFEASYPWGKALHDDTHLHYEEHTADIIRWMAKKRGT